MSIKTTENPENLVKNPNSPMLPHLVITEDDNGRVSEISIAAERQVLVETDDVVTGIISLLFLYYVCNFEYPKQCHNTFMFLQRKVLNVCDRVKVPTKVLLLILMNFFQVELNCNV